MLFSNLGFFARQLKKFGGLGAGVVFETSCTLFLKPVAEEIVRTIKELILEQKGRPYWLDLDIRTKLLKGSENILFRFGDLGKAVTWERISYKEAAVGIPKDAVNRLGINLAMLANVFEFGKVIPIDRARAAQIARVLGAKLPPELKPMTAKGFIEIPSRSFISLGFELAKVDVQFEKFIPLF